MRKSRDVEHRAALRRPRFGARSVVLAGMVLALPAALRAQTVLPRGGSVVSGQAGIGAAAGNALTITQNSSRAIVNWDSFSVGANGSVNFVQPNASSAILNRVTGSTASTIAGAITANGQVFLVNPNGIAITPSGTVQVGGGFVASTLDIGNADFNAGNLSFAGNGASASVSNAGSIASAPGGFVALIGGTVSSSGTIRVPLGKVGLGSGERATLDPTGDGFLQVAVPTGSVAADGRALVDVSGRVSAAGGAIAIQAATAQAAVRDAVNVSGALSARSVSGRSGNIVLGGGDGGNVVVSGTLSATGGKRHAGGTIVVTGADVRLTSSASLDASGTSGGDILVGGDMRGGIDPSVKLVQGTVINAQTTAVDQGAVINVNGTTGAGGNAVVWSDLATDFRGTITATGAGTASGGAVEVSSHGVLGYAGMVDVRAASGKTGTLLLDPYDVTISNGTDTNIVNGVALIYPYGNSSILSVTTLQNALAVANVTVDSGYLATGAQNGDITVANAVTWNSGNSLTLSSTRDIDVNANITSNGGGLTLSAGRSVNVTSATIDTAGGNLAATASTTDTTNAISLSNATINVGSGTGTLTGQSTNGLGVLISGTSALTASSGSITLSGSSATSTVGSGSGMVLRTNSALTTAGAITLNGTGGTTNKGHGITMESGSSVTSTGSLTMNGVAQSASYNGINFSNNNTITANSGTVSVNGTSNASGAGMGLGAGTLSLANNGGGTFSLNGVSSSGSGFGFNAGTSITSSGAVSISGQSTSANGFYFAGNNTMTDNAGNLAIGGTSNSGYGMVFQTGANTLTNRGAGSFAISGDSQSNDGVNLNTNVGITSAGGVSVSGTSANGSGVGFDAGSSLTASNGGLGIIGSSNSGAGIAIAAASLTNSGAGSFTLIGTSGSGNGTQFGSGATLATSGAVSLTGISTGGYGFTFTGSNAITASRGDLTLTGGSSSSLGMELRGTSTITNNGSGTLIVNAAGGADLAASIRSSNGALELSGSGTINQSGGSVTAANLLLSGASGNFILNAAGNQIGTVAASAASVALTDSSAITVNSVLGTTGATTTGSVSLVTAGNLTIAGGATVSGTSPVLAAAAAFINNAGGGAVSAASGRWLVYSNTSAGDTFGGLNSGNTAVWGATYASLPPGSVSASGNRYLFATQPVLTVTSTSASKTYGTDASGSIAANDTISGVQAGVANAYLGDSAATAYSGAAAVTSSGAAATANVSGSPYAIDVALGTLTSPSNYSFAFQNSGQLTVTPAAVNVTAVTGSSTYGSSPANAGLSATGLQNGENVSVLTGLSNGITTATNAGGYAVGVTGALTNANYTVAGTTGGSWTVNQAPLTISSSNQSKAYGTNYDMGTTAFTTSGLLNSDSVTGATLTSAGSGAAATVAGGPYGITASAAVGSGLSNYNITYDPSGQLTVNPASLIISSSNQSKTYGTNYALGTTAFTTSGLANSDSVASVTLASAGTGASATVAGGPYGITPSAAAGSGLSNYSITYDPSGQLTVNPAPLTITSSNQSKTYGTNYALGTTAFTASGLLNSDSVTNATLASVGTAATATVAGGPYDITPSAAVGSGLSNYNISYDSSGRLTVNPAGVSVTALGGSSSYGSSPANPGLSATGLQNGQDVSALTGLRNSFGITNTSNAGGYTLDVGGALTNSNYTVTSTHSGSWTVNPVTVSVTALGGSSTYGASPSNPGLSATGLQNGEGANVLTGLRNSFGVSNSSDAGSYALNVAGALTNSNYTVAGTQGGSWMVNPAPVTVTALGGSSFLATSPVNPGLSATGLQNGQDVNALTGLRNSFGVTSSSDVGSYVTDVTGSLTNPNYIVAAIISGSWTVKRSPDTSSRYIPGSTVLQVAADSGLLDGLNGSSAAVNMGRAVPVAPVPPPVAPVPPPAAPAPPPAAPVRPPAARPAVPDVSPIPSNFDMPLADPALAPLPAAAAPPPPVAITDCSDREGSNAATDCAAPPPPKKAAVPIAVAPAQPTRHPPAEPAQSLSSMHVTRAVLTKVAAGTGIGLSFGLLAWLLRDGGTWLTVLLYALPLWRKIVALLALIRRKLGGKQDQPASDADLHASSAV